MRKLIATGAACVVALSAGATAQAGPEAGDSAGNFIVMDADFSPPATTGRTVKVSTVNFDVSFGNKRNGSPFPQTERLLLTLPAGSKYNGKKFPKCTESGGQLACGKDAEVGDGSAVIDARNLVAGSAPINATVTAYNGPLRGGRPTLVLLAKATVNGNPLEAQISFVWNGRSLELFFVGDSRIAYSFSSFNLELGASFKSKVPGRPAITTSLIQAPKGCSSRGWAFSLFHQDTSGSTITARDRQPCLKVVG